MSPAFERIWDCSRQDLSQRLDVWLDFVHPEDRPRLQRCHLSPMSGPMEHEYRIMRLNGSIRWVRSRLLMVPDDSEAVRYEVGIVEDITEYREVLSLLWQSEWRYRKLVEEEQQRLARDLHDEFGQLLPALRSHIDRLGGWLGKKRTLPVKRLPSPEMPDRITPDTRKGSEDPLLLMEKLVDGVGAAVRRAINRLRPELLGELGFLRSLRHRLHELERDHPTIQTSFMLVGEEKPLPSGHENELFRIFQEALTNVVKHAGADRVVVRLVFVHPVVILDIRDNGRGFDMTEVLARPLTSRGGLGLRGMRERTAFLGGTLRVRSIPGAGTAIRAELPLG